MKKIKTLRMYKTEYRNIYQITSDFDISYRDSMDHRKGHCHLFYIAFHGSHWETFKTFRGANAWLARMEGKKE